MIIHKLSSKLGSYICQELKYDEEKEEIISYAIENLILSLANIVAILVLASIFDASLPALIAVIFGGTLRKVSGGAHFDNPFKCLAFGTFIYTLIGVLSNKISNYGFVNNTFVLLIILFGCLIIVGILAPVDSPAKPIHSETFKKQLKVSSIIIVTIAVITVSLVQISIIRFSIVLGIIYQTITLLPIFNKKRR